jgi:hypothetical protein
VQPDALGHLGVAGFGGGDIGHLWAAAGGVLLGAAAFARAGAAGKQDDCAHYCS